MKNNKQLIPSLLSFNKNEWSRYFIHFEHAGIEYIHFDVMQKEYVNNVAFNEKDFHKFTHSFNNLKANVHLMVLDPLKEIEKYFHKKTNAISFHFDVYKDPKNVFTCLEKIKNQGIKAGIAISPNFNVWEYEQYLPECDFVTVMGVYPGFGGQSFDVGCLQNIDNIKEWCKANKKDLLLEIDGGMNEDIIRLVINNVDYVVAGTYLAKNFNNLDEVVHSFNELAK